jgi:hypothetical protein
MDQVISAVFGVITEQTGRWVVWLISLGKWRGETLLGNEGRLHSAAGSLSFIRNGQRVITHTGLLLMGTVFYVLLFVLTIIFAALF